MAEVLCAEGEVVEAGRALIRLEAFDLGDRRAQAEANLRAEQANLERLRNGYRKEEIAQAKAHIDRLSAIVTKLKAGPLPEEVRASESRVALARAQQERAKTSYDRVVLLFKRETGTVSREDVDRATEELRITEETLKVRQEELQLFVTGTPAAGRYCGCRSGTGRSETGLATRQQRQPPGGYRRCHGCRRGDSSRLERGGCPDAGAGNRERS